MNYNENITVQHGEFTITYYEHSNRWIACSKDSTGEVAEGHSLREVKEKLDKLVKASSGFKRHAAIEMEDNQPKLISVTSYCEDLNWEKQKQVWVVDAEKKRRKVSLRNLYEAVGENLDLLRQIDTITQEVERLHQQREKLVKAMQKYSWRGK